MSEDPSKHDTASHTLDEANELRDEGNTAEALLRYDEAMQQLGDSPATDEEKHLGANIYTNRGIALMETRDPAELPAATHCFEKAIALRKGLPMDADPLYPWGLAASWLNLGEAMGRQDTKELQEESVRCFDVGLKVLEQMPPESHPSLDARLGVAWMNRGVTLQRLDEPKRAAESFDRAVKTIEAAGKPDDPELRRLLMCALLNRGQSSLHGDPPDAGATRRDASQSIEIAEEMEKQELMAAEIGLQARHLLGRSLVQLQQRPEGWEDWVSTCTDAVDEGLALARLWASRDIDRLDPLAFDLFRFGGLLYRLYQPHFLAEYLLDNLDPERSPGAMADRVEMHHIATEALWSAVEDLKAHAKEANDQGKWLAILNELQATEQRLTQIREEALSEGSEWT